MELIRYQDDLYPKLFALLIEAGSDWETYCNKANQAAYRRLLQEDLVFCAMEDERCIGYVRAKVDGIYGIYVYDLLVHPGYRGRKIGQSLLNQIQNFDALQIVYVMSDVDTYYQKLGYERIGSIFSLTKEGSTSSN